MDITKLSPGKNAPETINVVIEIPLGSSVKYELDKESGAVVVDRLLSTAMFYPANYGFIPGTLSKDGDPTDVLVLGHSAFQPGSVVACKPVAVLMMEDEAGLDEKIIARPLDKVDPTQVGINDLEDLSTHTKEQIGHFFARYKDLEKGKWVKVSDWKGAMDAKDIIKSALV